MSSNIDEFELKIARHFTAIELVEYLNLTTEDIVDRFSDVIERFYPELREEIE